MTGDAARQLADESIERLERRFKAIYSQAYKEMRAKQEKALRRYQNELSERKKALDDTPEAMKAHKEWLRAQAANQAWISSMVDGLAESATNATVAAINAVNGSLPATFAESANYAAFSIDKGVGFDTAFSLVDADTVTRLQMGGEPLLKEVSFPKVDRAKDMRWNRQRFHSAITQGILQGESVSNIAKRTRDIYGSNAAAALRAARTATTNAENAGRLSSFERAADLGIKVKQSWMATLDDRTREEHRAMDGEEVEVGEKFSNGLRYPGDPFGAPEEVWNCRCTLVASVEGVDKSDADRWDRLPAGTSYEDWKDAKKDRGSRWA